MKIWVGSLWLCLALFAGFVNGEKNPKCGIWAEKFDKCLRRGFEPKIFKECKVGQEEKRQDYCIRFEKMLKNKNNECNYDCSFLPVQPNQRVNFDDSKTLEVRTSSALGSNAKMYVYFKDENDDWAGAFLVLFGREPSYQIGWCYENWQPLPKNLPMEQDKTWLITRTPKGMKVSCNGVEVLDVELEDEVCDRSNLKSLWSAYWEREITTFFIPTTDDASISYKIEEIEEIEEHIECPADKPSVMCSADPCDVESCLQHPDAICTVNHCGECSAVFRHKNGTVVESCEGEVEEAATCPSCIDVFLVNPDGTETSPGMTDPSTNSCSSPKEETCPEEDHVCATHTMIYRMGAMNMKMKTVSKSCMPPQMSCQLLKVVVGGDIPNMELEDCELEFDRKADEVERLCPEGERVAACYSNPCEMSSCPNYPTAECRGSFCGYCHAEYFDNEGNLIDDCEAM